ncbi:AMP-binding protein, partial [Aquimarina muelleri]|uniref:AMP-binding protein n=1 Tax=Aquimarina muelleri TaxID=279356 RepID=UPI00224920F3
IVCNPGSRLGDLTLLRTIEKEELLVRSTGFFSAIPEVTIMDLFDSQVSKTPTAVALVYGDTELSYIDLYDRSNCLASHLQNHYHISTGDYVGVMQDRSDWSIISILGILKSGGVYVPIDV